jgi:hypothetical protein
VSIAQSGIDDMEGPVALLEPLDDEWNEEFFRLLWTIHEGGHVAVLVELLAGKPNGAQRCGHRAGSVPGGHRLLEDDTTLTLPPLASVV